MIKKSLLALTVLVSSSSVMADNNCNTQSIIPSHQQSALFDKKDGTVLDIVNDVLWSKCSLGQIYESGTCKGVPTSFETWDEALQAVNNLNNNERLPNTVELSGLIEHSCYDPAIDISAFPNTPSGVYWTNTPDPKGINNHVNLPSRIVDFKDGSEFLLDVNSDIYVRTVIERQ